MSKTTTKGTPKRITKAATIIVLLLFCVVPGCIAKDAVKTEIQGIRNDMGQLEKVVDQKADNTVVAEQVDEINNRIEQTAQIAEDLSLWKKSVQAETINYGGAGWVVVGTGVMALIFVGAGCFLIRAFMKRGSMLSLLTCVIHKVGKFSPEVVHAIKKQLKNEASQMNMRSPFTERDRQNLGKFAKKNGTFAEQKVGSDV